jgi:hypothetical protein
VVATGTPEEIMQAPESYTGSICANISRERNAGVRLPHETSTAFVVNKACGRKIYDTQRQNSLRHDRRDEGEGCRAHLGRLRMVKAAIMQSEKEGGGELHATKM